MDNEFWEHEDYNGLRIIVERYGEIDYVHLETVHGELVRMPVEGGVADGRALINALKTEHNYWTWRRLIGQGKKSIWD